MNLLFDQKWVSKSVFFLLSVLFLAGCVSAKSEVAPYAFYPPVEAEHVYVYRNYPPVSYEVIGEISGRGYSYTNWDQIYKQMRKKAASIGGTGIVILTEATPIIATQHVPASVNITTSSPQNTQTAANTAVSGQSSNNQTNALANMNATASYTPARTDEITEKVVRGVVIRFKQQPSLAG